jgi:serine protease inhibitor
MRAMMPLIVAAGLALATAPMAWGEGAGPDDALAPAVAAPPVAVLPAPLDPTYLNGAQSRLGFQLITRINPSKVDGNLMVSPASVAAVLALLDLGANAKMRAALLKVLGLEQPTEEISTNKLAALRASVKAVQADANGPLASANAIVFDPKAAPYPKMIPELAAAGAQVTIDDLDDPATIQRINNWVKERTAGLIPSIIEKAPRDGGLVALNALHFKECWRDPFDPSLTRPARFRGLAATFEVPMMQSEGKLQFREQDGFIAVELPYAADRFRLVLITSKDKPRHASEFRPAAGWLAGDGFTQRSGEISMPRFTLASSADLLDTLDALGLKAGRNSAGALAGLSPAAMSIAQVLQRTELRVDETGTEAAASTAVTTTREVATDFVKMTVDKPFLFALRDTASGLVLLTGFVENPKGPAS